jgi:hypothetical protein
MWAKSALLSALFATGVFATPAGVAARQELSLQARQPVILAQGRGERGERGERGPAQCTRPLRDAIDELRSRYGGSYVGHDCLEQGGRAIYVIRWRMPDGQLRDFRVSGN